MEKRKELEEKFNELKKNQLIPAHYYCLHHDPDTGKIATKMDPLTGKHICSICGREIYMLSELNSMFNHAIDQMDCYMDYIKETIGDEDDKVDDLEEFILHLKNIRKLADKFNTYIIENTPVNPGYSTPPAFYNPTTTFVPHGTGENIPNPYFAYLNHMTPPVNPIMENKDGLSPEHQKMMDELFKDDKPDVEGLPYDAE